MPPENDAAPNTPQNSTPPNTTPPAPAASSSGAPATPQPNAAEQPIEIGEDGDVPAEAKGKKIVITYGALEKRMSRASRAGAASALKDIFGTDDVEKARASKAEGDKALKTVEDKRRSEMTEIERLKTEKQEAEQRASAAEQRAVELEDSAALTETSRAIDDVAAKYVDGKYLRIARQDFADHLADKYKPEELAKLVGDAAQKECDEFMAKWAKDNPRLSKEPAPATPVTPTPPAKVPVTTGSKTPQGRGPNPRPAPKSFEDGPWKGKTLAPGHPNSMSAQEVAEWKRQKGYST